MLDLINNYTTTAPTGSLSEGSAAVNEYQLNQAEGLFGSIMFKSPEDRAPVKNSLIVQTLNTIEELENNWDEDGAIAPSQTVIGKARAIINLMTATGEAIYTIAPGPRGEIMIDLRRGNKSLELLFYEKKSKYVTFATEQNPTQGEFKMEILPELITWLNS